MGGGFMAEILDIEVTKSVDIVHVGDEFLFYITIRNKFSEPISRVNISYDLPKGFHIRMKGDQTSFKRGAGWKNCIMDSLQGYFYVPNESMTVFGSRRSMGWSTNILSGESYTITLPVRAGAMFVPNLKPDTYHLIFDIEYTYGNAEHNHQAKKDLIVYPHVGSIYFGAVMGGIIGAFLRMPSLTEQSILQFLIGSLSGLVLAIVFRRKTNVQSFIAVEDYWGGFLIGIVAGYGGQETLGKFLEPGT